MLISDEAGDHHEGLALERKKRRPSAEPTSAPMMVSTASTARLGIEDSWPGRGD
jgi:hypothetical protein